MSEYRSDFNFTITIANNDIIPMEGHPEDRLIALLCDLEKYGFFLMKTDGYTSPPRLSTMREISERFFDNDPNELWRDVIRNYLASWDAPPEEIADVIGRCETDTVKREEYIKLADAALAPGARGC